MLVDFLTDFSGYIFGGYNSGTFLNDLWQYDPISDQWTEKTSMPAVARSASAHFVIGDTAYIICGKTADDYAINEVWAYSMSSDVWIQKNNFPFGNRWRASGASSQSKGYLLFGKNEILNYDEILYEYNPQIDSWSAIDTFPEAGRTHSSLLFFEDDLLVITGQDSNGNSYNDLWRYNLTAGSWDELNSIPADGRRGGISFHSSSAIYYSTGINQSNIRIKETWKNENPLTADPIEINSHLTLYPNPADNFFSIFGPQQSVNYKVQVYSISGELLMEGNAGSENSFDCSNLPNGFYTIFISTPGSVNCSKLIICH
ncbi:MAG: T9SS type A sorting domain-containing protein [Crocinitomicaceae bacterium]|nr:T9SS type A sorting domain-containing protein [Crocinitomicaceae bacterium]